MVGLILVACGGAAPVNPELSAAPAVDAATTVPVPTTAPTETPAAPAGAYINRRACTRSGDETRDIIFM